MPSTIKVAVILQGSTHQIWKWIQAGAAQSARDLQGKGISVDIHCKSPLREDDSEEQAKIFEDLIREGVDGVVLAPFDNRTLVGPVEEAAGGGIPTVVVDSALDTEKIVSFIATDNKKGGALAAERMGELLVNGGKVLLQRYRKGSSSTEAREQGFAEKMRSRPGFEVIPSEEFAGGTRDSAKRAAGIELGRYANDLKGIFTPNESSTAGMVMALQSRQLAGKIAHVGFDTSDIYLDSLRRKQILGLVVQNPFLMGKLAVETIVDHLNGKTVPKRIDTGVTMVTPDNIDAPEIKVLVSPPFAR
jgi:ribose transport system substrate-binding protein